MGDTSYADQYRDVDFRKYPEKYVVGKGEQGVLMAEPYKSEILPYWKFATPEAAQASAEKIYELFEAYKNDDDFVGMDMARKFLQMGFTRARRYANHASGSKYNDDGSVKPQDAGSEESPKAAAAKIFYNYYVQAREDAVYKARKSATYSQGLTLKRIFDVLQNPLYINRCKVSCIYHEYLAVHV